MIARVFSVTIGVVIGIALWQLLVSFSPIEVSLSGSDRSQFEISNSDFVSILLTAISVILAALGFVIALLAFVGWRSIARIAEQAGEQVVKDSLRAGGSLNKAVRAEIQTIYKYQGVEGVLDDEDFVESARTDELGKDE